jgi:hypothetical protein
MSKLISLDDIKYDLLKLISPLDGTLGNNDWRPASILFNQYLSDLKREGGIRDYSIYNSNRESAITYDITIRVSLNRAPKKLKIHVGKFKYPWC